MTDFDVAIVGYGPTGTILASLLGRLGRKVVVFERYRGLYNLPRAACFDDETMRTFQTLGVAQAMLPGINVQRGYEWINGAGETLLEIEYDDPAHCGWAQLYMMYQPHMEDVLDKLAKSWPSVDVRQGVNVQSLSQDADGVAIQALGDDGVQHMVRARYVVGADGGNGFVRSHMGGALHDYGFHENWLVCDFKMLRQVEGLPSFRQVCNPAQPISIVNIGPSHHRFSFRLEAEEDRCAVTEPASVWARVRDYLTPEDAEIVRVANYTFRSRIVDQWRMGRIFLAGDAAHEMPPFLAQGMVSGIRDARNLAWKLDMVLAGMPDSVLDTYQPEREPHVRFITEKAIELGRVQTMRDPEQAKVRDARLLAARRANQKPEKLKYPPLQSGFIESHGGLFPQGQVRADGRTVLLDDVAGDGWRLILRDGEAVNLLSAEMRQSLEAVGASVFVVDGSRIVDETGVIGAWFDEAAARAALVRPDHYVFGVAANADGLRRVIVDLCAKLGLPSP